MNNPNKISNEHDDILNSLPKMSWIRETFFTVTTFSKAVAGVIMIVLPFLGSYIGYKYSQWEQKQNTYYVPQFKTVNTQNLQVKTPTKTQQVVQDSQHWLRFHFGELSELFKDLPISSTTIRYVESDSAIDRDNRVKTKYTTLQDVKVHPDIISVTRLPFLSMLIETPEALFFTAPSFSGKELSGSQGIFKLDLQTRELVELKNSRFYNVPIAGSVRIPGTNKFLTAPEYPIVSKNKSNSELYVIDPIMDSVSLISPTTNSIDEHISYCAPAMGCGIDFSMIDNSSLEVTKHIRKSREQGGGLYTEREVLNF